MHVSLHMIWTLKASNEVIDHEQCHLCPSLEKKDINVGLDR